MAVYSIEKLSGSIDGKGIKVTGTSAAADVTVHTAGTGNNDMDLVTLWAANNDASASRLITLAWGAETDPDDLIRITIPARAGLHLLVDRMPIMNGLVIGAWADEANDVVLFGRIERVNK